MGDSILKISRLQGSDNWELWAIRMEAVLTEKGYYDVMTEPAEAIPYLSDEEVTLRQTKLKKALAYIRLALADGPLMQTRNITNPCELWTYLKTLYEPKGFSSEFLLCKHLFETTLAKSGNSIEKYINQIKRLTDDLETRKIKIPDKVIAAWTLNNLTPDYESTVAMISQQFRNSTDDIRIDELFAHLIDESRRLKARDPDEMAVLSQKGRNNKKSDPKTSEKCTFCKKSGHKDTACWKKHPNLFKRNPKPSAKPKEDTSGDASEISGDITLISHVRIRVSK